MKIVVIGSVAAGTSVAAKARRRSESAEIIVYDKDIDISYSACGIPYYIGSDMERNQLTPRDSNWFKDRYNIHIRTRHEVIEVDKDRKRVKVKDLNENKEFFDSYDKLILATGASPIKPPIKGIDKKNIFFIRNIKSGEEVKRFIRENNPKKATVVGGGFIGLEMVENLLNHNIELTLIDKANQIAPALDKDMAIRVEEYLKDKDVKLILEDGVSEIKGQNGVEKIVLDSGEEIETDFLIMAIGVRPNISLAKEAGIALGETGAIKVNERLETNIKDIWAVGDCAQAFSLITNKPIYRPLGTTANKMGRIVGDRITGGEMTFRGILGTGIFKVIDLSVAHTGLSEDEAKSLGYEVEVIHNIKPNKPKYYDGSTNMVIKAIGDKRSGNLLGAQIIGGEGVDKRIDIIVTAITYGAKADDLFHLDLAYSPPFSTTKDPVIYTGMILDNAINRGLKIITPQELMERSKVEEIRVIDVRAKEQYERSHVDGAINIPLAQLRDEVNQLDKDIPTVTYCNKGVTGNAAQNLLLNLGFKEVYNLSGGHQNYAMQKVK